MALTVDIGDLVRVKLLFTDHNGQPADPATLTAKYKTPAGAITTLVYGTDAAVVQDSVGAYHFDVSSTAAGTYYVRGVGTGTAAAAAEGSFTSSTSAFST